MLTEYWKHLEKLPLGRAVFNRLIGLKVPYTGTIHAQVLELVPGRSRVQMKDRRRVRNHFDCIHAVALVNLAELASGLALTTALPSDARGILHGFNIEYIAKARGTVTAESQAPEITSNEKKDIEVTATIRNEENEIVCRAKALWYVGPKR